MTQFIPVLFALLGVSFRYFSNWCIDSVSSCYGSWIHQAYQYFTSPLYFFSLFVLPIAIILAFVPRATFNSWLKFAAWSIPLLVIFIATQPVAPSSFLSTDRDDAARLAGQVFAAASLILLLFGLVRAYMYKSDKDKYGINYANADIKDLKLIFATGIGFLSVNVVAWMLFYKSLPLSLFGLFFATGIVAILSNIYALLYVVILSYQKARTHTPFGWKLILSQSLLGITAIIILITGLVATSS